MKTLVCDMTGVVFIDGRPNIRLLELLMNIKNVNVCFNTGKGYLGMRECLESFEFKGPMSCENGALITFLDGKTVLKHTMENKKLIDLVYDMIKQGVDSISFCNLNTYKYIFWLNNNIVLRDYFYAEYITHTKENFLIKMLESEVVRLIVKTSKKFDIEKYKKDFDISVSADEFYSITAKGINKKTAACEICRYLNTSLSELIVVGNDYNDIDMFSIGEAMKISIGNTCPKELISKSDFNFKLEDFYEWLRKGD